MESVLFKRNIKPTKDDYSFNESKQPWFSDECREKRILFYRHLNIYMSNKQNSEFRRDMVMARSEYKKVLRHCRYEHRRAQTEKLVNYKAENAKNYWKMLKNLCPSSSSKKVTSQQFVTYFKAINDPESRFFFRQMMMFYYLMKGMSMGNYKLCFKSLT